MTDNDHGPDNGNGDGEDEHQDEDKDGDRHRDADDEDDKEDDDEDNDEDNGSDDADDDDNNNADHDHVHGYGHGDGDGDGDGDGNALNCYCRVDFDVVGGEVSFNHLLLHSCEYKPSERISGSSRWPEFNANCRTTISMWLRYGAQEYQHIEMNSSEHELSQGSLHQAMLQDTG